MKGVPGVVDAGWEGMFGSETVAWRDADHAVLGDKEAEEWDLQFRVANTVAAAVEHQQYGKAVG